METSAGLKPPPPGVPDLVSKALPLIGMIVSGLVVVLFLADLAAGFPFQRKSIGADVGFIVAGAIIAYLSWSILERSRPRVTPPSAPNR
jgi:hypothetical protein